MSPEFKNALITFGRGLFAAMVAGAIAYAMGLDLAHLTDTAVLGKGLLVAAIDAGLLFLGAFLRNTTTAPVTPQMLTDAHTRGAVRPRLAGPHLARTRSWADALPF